MHKTMINQILNANTSTAEQYEEKNTSLYIICQLARDSFTHYLSNINI